MSFSPPPPPFIVSYLCKHMSHTWQHILLLGLLRMNRKLGRGTDVRGNKGSRFVRTKLLISNVAWLHIKSVEIYVRTRTDAEIKKEKQQKKNVMFSKKFALIPKLLLDNGQMYSVLIPPQASLRSLPLFFPSLLTALLHVYASQAKLFLSRGAPDDAYLTFMYMHAPARNLNVKEGPGRRGVGWGG